MGKMGTAGVLRLRATSAVSCDKSARRSAQNDGLCDFRIIGVDWAPYTDCASVPNVGAPIEASSLSALTLKGSCTSTIVESSCVCIALYHSVYSLPVDSPTEYKGLTGLGSDDEVLLIDGPLDSSGLVRAFEVPFDRGSSLLEVKILGRGCSIGIVAIQRPFTGDICWSTLRRHLLRPSDIRSGGEKCCAEETIGKNFHLRILSTGS
jgi:hypothetical protein